MASDTVQVIYRGPSHRVRPDPDSDWAYKDGEPFAIAPESAAMMARKGGGGHRFEIVGRADAETTAAITAPEDSGRSIDLPANPDAPEDAQAPE